MHQRPSWLAAFAAALSMAPMTKSAVAAPVDADAVVVTASRTAQIADETLAPVIVIGRNEIERNPTADVADLLRLHAGIDIGRNGGPAQTTSVFLRGTDSNHTLVMVDGVRINTGTIGGAPIQNIALSMIERIEVVKGPRSTLYGSDAIGGVINIITRRAEPETRFAASAGAGGNDTRSARARVNYGGTAGRTAIAVSRVHSDGIPPRTGSDLGGAYDNTNAYLHATSVIGNTDIALNHWQGRGTVDYLDFFLSPQDQDFDNRVTSVRLITTLSSGWTSTLELSHTVDEVDQNQSNDFAHTQRSVLDWQNDVSLGQRQLLTAGVMLSREETASLSSGTAFDVETAVDAAYVQDDISLGRHHVILGARHTDHETFGGHSTWNLEYGAEVTTRLRLLAAAGTAFRAPDSTDRFGFGGNPDLDPETSRNLELGARFSPREGTELRASAYRNDIDDLIEYFDPDGFLGPQPGTNQNIDSVRIEGIELGAAYRTGPWQLSAEATFQDPHDREDGSTLLRRAKRTTTLSALYRGPSYRIGADVLHTGEREDIGNVTLNPYTLVNLNATIELHRRLTLAGRIENAFDEDYTLAATYNTLGRAVFLELRYSTEP